MKITKEMIKTDKPDININEMILALHNDSIYCESNLYIPKWTVTNRKYYVRNIHEFEGYIELEHVPINIRSLEQS